MFGHRFDSGRLHFLVSRVKDHQIVYTGILFIVRRASVILFPAKCIY